MSSIHDVESKIVDKPSDLAPRFDVVTCNGQRAPIQCSPGSCVAFDVSLHDGIKRFDYMRARKVSLQALARPVQDRIQRSVRGASRPG